MIYAVIVPAAAVLLTLVVLAARRRKKAPEQSPPAAPLEETVQVEPSPASLEESLGNPDFVQAAIILSAAGVIPERPATLRCSLCAGPVALVDEEDVHALLREGRPSYCECCLVGVQQYQRQQEDRKVLAGKVVEADAPMPTDSTGVESPEASPSSQDPSPSER